MANLIQLSDDLEFVNKNELIQMSQDPNSRYPSYLVLAEIKRRTMNEKAYAAQQPRPETTVSEEVIQEFAGPQGLGAMAQSSGSNAFPPDAMSNMAPPSGLGGMPSPEMPMQMAGGGRTSFEEGKKTNLSYRNMATMMGINIDNLSDEQIKDAVNQKSRRDSLLFQPSSQEIMDASMNPAPIPAGLQSRLDAAQEPSGFDKFVEGGTQFFFGDARPDAKYPNLARATDEPMDALNYIAPLKGLQMGVQGLRATRAADKIDDVADLSRQTPTVIPKTVDNILPTPIVRPATPPRPAGTPPATGATPPAVVPRPGATPPTTGGPLVPVIRNVDSVAPRGGPLVPSGGPLAVVPKVADDVAVKSKGLISKGIDLIKNNKFYASLFGIGSAYTAKKIYDNSGEPKKDNGTGGTGSTAPTTKEIKRSMDPLDLAKLGGIIMGAKNTSELGQGITALAGDIQERRYKEGILKSKEDAMIIDRINALSKAMESITDQTSQEYIQAKAARQYLIQSLYGPMAQGTDPMSILNANTASGTNNSNVSNINSLPNTNLGGSLGLSGSSLTDTFINAANQKKKPNITIIPQQDLYNAFIKNAPNPEYLTGDPYIDNIMRIESGGMDRTNSITGASGPMQVKPATLADPGYDVEPAKDDSVEERIRVGADYFNAMKEVFDGDILNATIAFNLGPGATKKWLQAGGTAEELVKIQSSDGRPVGQTALEYIQKAYGPDIINRLS